jgi:hypothetical protein
MIDSLIRERSCKKSSEKSIAVNNDEEFSERFPLLHAFCHPCSLVFSFLQRKPYQDESAIFKKAEKNMNPSKCVFSLGRVLWIVSDGLTTQAKTIEWEPFSE